ncbi:hypothetical protein E2C01_089811 [Portunus trituberculatus]|uniref:Uncharacterized protein n=1 Tax=Portunus trituberculatus TaxID=210409 RepID=A0A5B7JJT5_PORTR|nr:hypothetical protein [Portunus trituberculatus]
MVRATQLTLHDVDLVGRGEDRRVEGYMDPPPWAAAAATIHITPLPCKKTQCPREMLLARANDTFLQTGTAGTRVYYRDGSVDPNTALRRTPVKDNVRLITMTRLLLSRLKNEGKRVTLDMDSQSYRFQQIKKLARSATTQRTRKQRRDAEAHSATLQWQALATNGEPLVLPSSISRCDRVSIHRLRLGYPTVR